MKCSIFYFTTSGNTEALAGMLQEVLESKGYEVTCSDFDNADVSSLNDSEFVALGSPAQGTEEIDESAFMPFYNEHLDTLKGKKLFLFGCFGWGDGQYMLDFVEKAQADGCNVIGHYTHLESPDDSAKEGLESALASL